MDQAAALAAIRSYEKSIRPGIFTALARRLGTTRWFAAVYRNVGPVIDPALARRRDGQVLAKVYGFPTLLLTSLGARSGLPRSSPLLYVRDGDDFLVVGTNFGQSKHPGWTANLLHDPVATVLIGGVELGVRAAVISGPEWDAQFRRFVLIYPGYANYLERRAGLVPRMFRLSPVGQRT